MALRGQGTLQSILGKPLGSAKRRKSEKDVSTPGTRAVAKRQKCADERTEQRMALTSQVRPPPRPHAGTAKRKATSLPALEQRAAQAPITSPGGNGWTRIDSVVVGLRFRRSSAGAAAAVAAAAAAAALATSRQEASPPSANAASADTSTANAAAAAKYIPLAAAAADHRAPQYRLVPEPTNPRDPNAVQVVMCSEATPGSGTDGRPSGSAAAGSGAATPGGALVGYLPAMVARHLAPLLRAGRLESQVHVDWAAQTAPGSAPLVLFLRAPRAAPAQRREPGSSSCGGGDAGVGCVGAIGRDGCRSCGATAGGDGSSAAEASGMERPASTDAVAVITCRGRQPDMQGGGSEGSKGGCSHAGGAVTDATTTAAAAAELTALDASGRGATAAAAVGVVTAEGCSVGASGDGGDDEERRQVEAALAAAAAAAAAWRPGAGASGPGGGAAGGGATGPGSAAGEVLRANFAVMAEDVRRHDGHLLSPEEHALLGALLRLPPRPACLFLRLLLRRGPWFALRGIAYPECGDVGEAAGELVRQGLAARPAPPDWPQVAALLPVVEIRALLRAAPPLPPPPPPPPSRASILAYARPRTALPPMPLHPAPAPAPPLAASAAAALPAHVCSMSSVARAERSSAATSGAGATIATLPDGVLPRSNSAPSGLCVPTHGGGGGADGGFRSSGAGSGGGRHGSGPSRQASGGRGGNGVSGTGAGSRGGGAVGGAVGGKAAVLESLQQRYTGRCEDISLQVEALTGPCIRLAPAALELVGRMQRLYFLGEGPAADLGRFLATERGVIRYPPYTIRRSGSAFASRQQLLEYEEALRHATRLEECLEAGDDDGAAAALAPALAALRRGALTAVRWAGDAAVPVRAVPGPWPWEAAEEAEEVGTAEAERKAANGCGATAAATTAAVLGRGEADGQESGCDGDGCDSRGCAQQRETRCVRTGPGCGAKTEQALCAHEQGLRQGRHESVDLTLTSESEYDADGDGNEVAVPPARDVVSWRHVPSAPRPVDAAACREARLLAGGAASAQDCCPDAGCVSGRPLAHELPDGQPAEQQQHVGVGVSIGDGKDRGALDAINGEEPCQLGEAETEADARDVGDVAGDVPAEDDDVVYGDEYDAIPYGSGEGPSLGAAAAEDVRDEQGRVGTGGVQQAEAEAERQQQDWRQQQDLQQQQQQQRAQAGGPAHPFLARFCAAWVYASMGTVGVSLLERQRRYGAAVALLRSLLRGTCCPGRRGEWWGRLSLDLQHLGREEEALQVAEAALADPWVRHGDRLSLQRRVLRLGRPPRRWRRPAWAAAALAEPREVVVSATMLRGATGLKSRFIAPSCGGQAQSGAPNAVAATATPDAPADVGLCGNVCGPGGAAGADGGDGGGEAAAAAGAPTVGVEELALLHYASPAGGGWRGLHSEGGVWGTLWGLLMWDVVFADVPEVFRSPFQTAPLDLDTDTFLPSRRELVDARLQAIAGGAASELLRAAWSAHAGCWARGVNWERQPLEELIEIARCVGGLGLSVVCRLLSEDSAGWRGGMPDLLLWRPERGDAMVSEVKGPRDRLSDQQRAWLAALAAAEVRTEVLRVVEAAPGEMAEGGDACGGNGGGGGGGGGRRGKGRAARGRRAVAAPVAGGGDGNGGGGRRGQRKAETGRVAGVDDVVVISDDSDA